MLWLLHIAAIVFYPPALFVTIPLHVIIGILGHRHSRDAESPSPESHVRCPDCRELVRKDATVCKHCHCRLIPQA